MAPPGLVPSFSDAREFMRARQYSAEIDKQLDRDRERENRYIRLLLLGTAGSGKTTVLKQMKLIHKGQIIDDNPPPPSHTSSMGSSSSSPSGNPGATSPTDPPTPRPLPVCPSDLTIDSLHATDSLSRHPTAITQHLSRPRSCTSTSSAGPPSPLDLDGWAAVLRENTLDSLALIIDNIKDRGGGYRSALAEAPRAQPASRSFLAAVKRLMTDEGFQAAVAAGGGYNLLDSALTLIQDAPTVLSGHFKPTNDHILLARQPTSFITETVLTWFLLDQCIAMIYVVSLSSFDQPLPLDSNSSNLESAEALADSVDAVNPTTNQLQESMDVFEQVISHPLMKSTAIILFLNKIDVLRDKAKRGVDFKRYFPQFKGTTNTFEEITAFILTTYLKLNKNKHRKIYHHLTCATQTNQIREVLMMVSNIIIRLNLKKADLIE
ncbi:G-protein alpha subunit-domain-containing protein [Catenaria anguillulae PL171]|uniref:G-protein alpha subunit-domain-containing protein n=1 Tax=Catenaria anguillulae PL171 TaxID=765915 RepID=A0A1Y2H971_9FUNG|nr:G-protein alpha subunit-domain-containing protein [Catenaria anguillulae PL171]